MQYVLPVYVDSVFRNVQKACDFFGTEAQAYKAYNFFFTWGEVDGARIILLHRFGSRLTILVRDKV
jgi:hypothetical protein